MHKVKTKQLHFVEGVSEKQHYIVSDNISNCSTFMPVHYAVAVFQGEQHYSSSHSNRGSSSALASRPGEVASRQPV